MSKANLYKRLDRIAIQQGSGEGESDMSFYGYVVNGTYFGTICGSIHSVYSKPAPNRANLLKSFTPEQAKDIWMRYYSIYERGKLVKPSPEMIANREKIAAMKLQDWREFHLKHIL